MSFTIRLSQNEKNFKLCSVSLPKTCFRTCSKIICYSLVLDLSLLILDNILGIQAIVLPYYLSLNFEPSTKLDIPVDQGILLIIQLQSTKFKSSHFSRIKSLFITKCGNDCNVTKFSNNTKKCTGKDQLEIYILGLIPTDHRSWTCTLNNCGQDHKCYLQIHILISKFSASTFCLLIIVILFTTCKSHNIFSNI